MKVQIKKGRDGPATLACVRTDGSRTWSKVHPFFPEHDLTHLAVESVLGFTQAFFGLIAAGWNIDDFSQREMARRIPAEAVLAEHIVGLLDLERAQRERLTVDDFKSLLASKLPETFAGPQSLLTGDQLDRIRALRAELVSRWWSVAEGDTLELLFPVVEARKADRVASTHNPT